MSISVGLLRAAAEGACKRFKTFQNITFLGEDSYVSITIFPFAPGASTASCALAASASLKV
jgi:hypothetical protein